MTKWKYIEPGPDGITPVERIITNAEIIDEYFIHWFDMMRKAGKPYEQITEQNCIEDFVVVHWAERVNEP